MPISGLIVAIIGGMYFGVVTPTEAAAFGCLLSFAFALAYGELTRSALWTACVNSIAVTCVISIIIINGQILGFAVTQAGIGRGLSSALVELGLSPFAFFVFLFFLYVALGAMLEGISMMLLTVPVIYPTLEGDGLRRCLVRRDLGDPGRARAALSSHRLKSLRSSVHRRRRQPRRDHARFGALRLDALGPVLPALLLAGTRAVAAANDEIISRREFRCSPCRTQRLVLAAWDEQEAAIRPGR